MHVASIKRSCVYRGIHSGIVLHALSAMLPRMGVGIWITTPIAQPFELLNLQKKWGNGLVLSNVTPCPRSDAFGCTDIEAGSHSPYLMLSNIEVNEGCNDFSVCAQCETGIIEEQKLMASVKPRVSDALEMSSPVR